MIDHTTVSYDQIASTFRVFGEECKGQSKLYYQLANKIAEDPDLIQLSAKVRYGQPIPNSLLAAVHFLLLSEPDNSLARYYPSISGVSVDEIPIELFRQFCFDNAGRIIPIIQNRIVQTNVVSRCSYLAPVFSGIIAAVPERDVTIIDIGTSAGLTLNWDKYEYHYSNGFTVGSSSTLVNCEIQGDGLPPFQLPTKKIRKIGIDQHIIDPTDSADARWLRALIWPDQLERFGALTEALKNDGLKTIEFIQAETVSGFEGVISGISKEDLLIVYCTNAMYQWPKEMRGEFWEMLDRRGMGRDLYFLSAEGIKSLKEKYDTQNHVVELTTYLNGTKTQSKIAEINGHGTWMVWNAGK